MKPFLAVLLMLGLLASASCAADNRANRGMPPGYTGSFGFVGGSG